MPPAGFPADDVPAAHLALDRPDSPRPIPAVDALPTLHVGIIMDGNGRWALARGFPRRAGHRAGASAVRRTVSAAPAQGIRVLTLYAFSSDNWRRPAPEVRQLMRLFRSHLRTEAERAADEGVRVSVIGRRDRLPPSLVAEIEAIEARTRAGRTLHLQLAVDYSSRDAILAAALGRIEADRADAGRTESGRTEPGRVEEERSAEECSGEGLRAPPPPGLAPPTRESLRARIARAIHAPTPIPDVDLVIRTGGERRLSDFLLWESAYAELFFTPCLWPDFDASHLGAALAWFRGRERRFGALPERSTPSPPATSRG